jgi:hypothetical protein
MDTNARMLHVVVGLYLDGALITDYGSASLASGTFPGPLIVGEKVSLSEVFLRSFEKRRIHQNSDFSIKVEDQLSDTSMDLVTSIVRVSFKFPLYVSTTRRLSSLALARSISNRYQLCRWCCLRHAMPHCALRELHLCIQRGGSDRISLLCLIPCVLCNWSFR